MDASIGSIAPITTQRQTSGEPSGQQLGASTAQVRNRGEARRDIRQKTEHLVSLRAVVDDQIPKQTHALLMILDQLRPFEQGRNGFRKEAPPVFEVITQVRQCLEKMAPEALQYVDAQGNTPFHVFLMNASFDLELFCDDFAMEPQTPLTDEVTKATQEGFMNLIELFIDQGSPTGHQNHQGHTPLTLVAHRGLSRVVETFLNKGTAVPSDILLKLKTYDSSTLVKTLVEHGARVAVADNDGNTPLHQAVNFKTLVSEGEEQIDCAVQMVQAGASLEIKNQAGISPKDRVLMNLQRANDNDHLSQWRAPYQTLAQKLGVTPLTVAGQAEKA